MSLDLRRLTATTSGVLLIGLMIRESLSFWTGHPYDLEVWIRNAYFVSQGTNPYTAFLPPVPGLSFTYLNQTLPGVGYLPLWPLVVASLYRVFALIPGASRFALYFLLKQPPILGDVLLGFLIYRALLRWGASEVVAIRGLRFWMLFPYAILISAVWGMFDALVAVLVFAFLLSTRAVKDYAFLGVGIVLKWLPLIYLPYFVLRERGARRLGVVVSLATVAGLTALMFNVMGWDYVGATAMSQSASHGGGGGMTYVNLLQDPSVVAVLSRLGGFYVAMGFLWVPAVFLAGTIGFRRFAGDGPMQTVQALLLVTTAFFLTRWGVYEQYLTYLLPLFYLDVTLWHPDRKLMFRLTWVLASAYLLANNDLLLRFFGPVSSQAVDLAYSFDSAPIWSPMRTAVLYSLAALFTVHLIQLVWVLLHPSANTTPWLWRLASFRRRRALKDLTLSEVSDP